MRGRFLLEYDIGFTSGRELDIHICFSNFVKNRCKWSAVDFASELICLVSFALH
jgi:hypothetical protein